MKKAEFVDLVASDTRIGNKKDARDAVEAVLEGISAVLARGDDVSFTGFGKFSVKMRNPRQGVNPRTGEPIAIAGGPAPKFSAGAGLKARVKG